MIGEGMPGELLPPNLYEPEEADVTEDGMVLIAGVLYDEETLEEVDEEDRIEAERERLLEMLDEAGAEDEYDWPPVDLNPEGDPTRNGAFR